MKRRIQIDSAILSFFILLTGLMYLFPKSYLHNIIADDFMDFVGLLLIFSGTFLRMVGRGYKKAHSQNSRELVTTGPYGLIRNPMYLGSFLMGGGFVLLVWPWWSLAIFGWLFYRRFCPQILREEDLLHKQFKKEFEEYVRRVPRLFPKFKALLRLNFRRAFPVEVLWTTKEKWGFLSWPILAIFLESFQEKLVFGFTDLHHTLYLVFMAAIIFALGVSVTYRYG